MKPPIVMHDQLDGDVIDELRPPHPVLLKLAGRAPRECATTVAALPWPKRLPRGDGQAVSVVGRSLGAIHAREMSTELPDPAPTAKGRQPPPVPTTSIHSKSDGIVAWCSSAPQPSPRAGNPEGRASHVGRGLDLAVMVAPADRLTPPRASWKPVGARGARRWCLRTRHAETV